VLVVLTEGGSQAGFQLAGIDEEAKPLKWAGSKTEIVLSDHKANAKTSGGASFAETQWEVNEVVNGNAVSTRQFFRFQ
jgi:hypothetical protein